MPFQFPRTTPITVLLSSVLFFSPFVSADEGTTSTNPEVVVVPSPGVVKIDGKTADWDLSAGIWSYNTPQSVDKFSVWTHMMWDERGVYFLARYSDLSPLKNGTRGQDFAKSWTSDAYQARIILDDKKPDEHQMHLTMFYSTPEARPYMIVNHGGFGDANTGPARQDLRERFGDNMEKQGGEIAVQPWENGKGYNMEAFWPWNYLRLSGEPLKAGEEFVFGMEAMWGTPDGLSTWPFQRLADGVKNEKANRIFMFRARNDWGRAVIAAKGNLNVTTDQQALQARRLANFDDYKSYGNIPLAYELPDNREVTIAIDDSNGRRVRNLFAQYPRTAGRNSDHWDGLDDAGKPVPAGNYNVTVVDHLPFKTKFFNSLYNAAMPPWGTETSRKIWGADHGFPVTVATRGANILAGFTSVEGGTGLIRLDKTGAIQWTDRLEVLDVALDDNYAYTLALQIGSNTKLSRVVRRLNLQSGAQIPFENESKSVEIALPGVSEAPLNSSIAQSHGKIFVVIPAVDGTSRLFVLNAKTGVIENQIENSDLVAITDREDTLFGLSKSGAIVQLQADGTVARTLFTTRGLTQFGRLAVSQEKTQFAISDTSSNQVFVFDSKGKLVRTLGKGYITENALRPAGRFVETNFARPLGLDFDAENRLWVAEASGTSRRVTLWSPRGQLLKTFWGAADYGAMAGFASTADSSRFIAHGIEFQLDPNPNPWQRPTAEKPLIFHPDLAHERGFIYRLNGHEYAVTTPGYNRTNGYIVALRGKDGVFRPVVRMTYGKKDDGTAWVDRNGDGKLDEGETFTNIPGQALYWSSGWIRPDLTILSPNGRIYAPKGFSKSGVPLYDFANPVLAKNWIGVGKNPTSRSTPVMDMAGNVSDGLRYSMIDGRQGEYPNLFGRHDAPAARRGRIIAAFRTNGVVEDVPGVGSVTAIGGDRGEWFLMTLDGLYLSSLWQDIKGDVTMDETYIGPESFGGFLWRAPDGRVLTQLGGNSYRLMEIQGLETVRKQRLSLQVSEAQIEQGRKLAESRAVVTGGPVSSVRISRMAQLPVEAPKPDEELGPNWNTVSVTDVGESTPRFKAALAHDGTNLAIVYQVKDSSPWKNGESRPAYGFIGGDAVDLKLEVPGRGLQRLLIAPLDQKNTATLWQKTAAVKLNPQTYVVDNNPGNAQNFDVVREVPTAQIHHRVGPTSYSVLVKIPLAELGLVAGITEFKGDLGVILSDPAGVNRVARSYVFDKNTGLVADVPSESSLVTARWGNIIMVGLTH